ncbi:MAG TPA: hypothetical protein VH518_17620 [Tepidisphaeraceae bacterium]|jgi:Amt family ammonium transporter
MEALWVVVLATAALLVRVGQTLNAFGMARAKNAASAGFRSLADICVATLCFWTIGAAILFQQNNLVIGIQPGQVIGWRGLSSNWVGMLAVMLLATGIIGPVLAERSKLSVPLTMAALMAAFMVPLVAFWTRRGWLSELGFIDAGGAAAVHLTPALCAATAAILVGARDGKYNRDGSSNMIPGHSVPLMLMATLFMLVGWTPYMLLFANAVEGRDAIAANVFVAAAAGGFVSLVVAFIRFGKCDILLMCSGILGGLVSITAAAATVGTPAAFVIGAVAGVVIPWMTVKIDLGWKIDDPAGVIAIHGVGAIWALIASAIFAHLPAAERLRLLGIHALGIAVIAITTISLSASLLLILKSITGLRSKEADEYDGLDLAEHDINAHPDFQQTMIKSYHLREA